MDHGEIKFSENKTLLFTKHRELFYICVLSAVLDAISTIYFMFLLGPGPETNFIVKKMSYHYGIYLGPFLGKLYQLFALWGLSVIAPRMTRILCLVLIALNLSAFGINGLTCIEAWNHQAQ